MQKNAALRITESIGQGSEPQDPPGENPETAFAAGNAGGQSPNTGVNGSLPHLVSDKGVLSDRDALHVPCAPHESEPGHTYRLARKLRARSPLWSRGDNALHQPYPENIRRVPVPDVLFSSLSGLSGVAIRGALLLIRKAYRKSGDSWACSPRYWTARDLAGEYGLGMCRESLRRGMKELRARGWVAIDEGGAQSYRWRLSVPEQRYTPLPLPLLRAHPRISHSGLTLLLGIYRCTWGWTKEEEGEAVHRRHERLSRSELRSLTGLCGATVRVAADELRRLKAIVRDRPHDGSAWWWRPSHSFLRVYAKKIRGGTSDKRKSNNTHTRETAPDDNPVGHTKGGMRRAVPKPKSRGELSEQWQRRMFDVWTEEIGMTESVALHYLHIRAERVHTSILKALRRKRGDIENPARWAHAALENLWHFSIPNKSPDVRQSSGEAPIAKAFEALTEKSQGWEWDDGEEESANQSEARGLGVEPAVGVTHSEMCALIEDLGQPPEDWETVERCGKNPLFVPTKELANWAYFRRDSGNERFQEAARRVANLRARHEDREPPISDK